MPVTRRDFLKDLAFAAALVGLPDWASQLDEPPSEEMMSALANSSDYPWPWRPREDLGVGNPYVTVLNRIAFGPHPGDAERVQMMGIDAYIEEQLHPESIDDSALEQRLASLYPTLSMGIGELMHNYPQQRQRGLEARALRAYRMGELGVKEEREPGPAEVIYDLQEATLMRAIFSQRQLQEVLVDFWSNHFNIDIRKEDCRWLKTVDDREVIRQHAFGKFGDLLLASAQSPAMLTYLDNRLNVKGVPNENYAREIMELHSLGVDGGYTQKDVQELARAFTGWAIKPARQAMYGNMDYSEAGTFIFNAKQHDDGPKKILGVSLPNGGGVSDATKIIDVLAHHPSTAHFVSKKLVTRFVADIAPEALVQSAAQTFTQTGGDLRAVMGTILHSDEFKNSFAQKIKRPFELIASTARAVDMKLEDARPFALSLQMMGQGLFMHLTPDGYPDSGSAWINTNGLLTRWNFAVLVASGKVPRGTVDLKAAMNGASIKTASDAVDYWINYLLHRTIPDTDRQKLLDAVSPKGASASFDPMSLPNLVALILSSPHFQYR